MSHWATADLSQYQTQLETWRQDEIRKNGCDTTQPSKIREIAHQERLATIQKEYGGEKQAGYEAETQSQFMLGIAGSLFGSLAGSLATGLASNQNIPRPVRAEPGVCRCPSIDRRIPKRSQGQQREAGGNIKLSRVLSRKVWPSLRKSDRAARLRHRRLYRHPVANYEPAGIVHPRRRRTEPEDIALVAPAGSRAAQRHPTALPMADW